jgi:hypothetical protein
MTLSHLLHVLGTVVWIGGILMTFLVILPGSKAAIKLAPMVGNLMKEVAKRFTPLANIRILSLVATGIIIFYYDKKYTSFLYMKNLWNVLIVLRHTHLLSNQAMCLCFIKKPPKYGPISVLGCTFRGQKHGYKDFCIPRGYNPHYSPALYSPLPLHPVWRWSSSQILYHHPS